MTARMQTELPLEKTASQGGDDEDGGGGGGWDGRRKLTTWKLDFPCPSYLLCVAVSLGREAGRGERGRSTD